jgi:exopolysaccharide production protein ExoQ
MQQHSQHRNTVRVGQPPIRGVALLEAIPIFAFFFVLAVIPLQSQFDVFRTGALGANLLNRSIWLTLGGVAVALLIANRHLLDWAFLKSPPIVFLFAYLTFAVASVSWALDPEISLARTVGELMFVSAVLVPYALSTPLERIFYRLNVCCALGVAINIWFIFTTKPSPIGHTGFFFHKQQLGIFCSIAILLALHEFFFRGWRRILAVLVAGGAIWLLLESRSKGAFAFLFLSIGLAGFVAVLSRLRRLTPAIIVGATAFTLAIYERLGGNVVSRLGYEFYGDPTLTGRTYIWNYIDWHIAQRPWLGFGFHSYWLVPNSPHKGAPGFVKDMLSSHSGYMELKLETGYFGYWIFLLFVYAALHYAAPRGERFLRTWCLLSLMMFVVLINLMESVWMTGSPLWMLFLIVVFETVRISQHGQARAFSVAKRQPTGRGRGVIAGERWAGIPEGRS